jgi:transitional endoplasmic reticulum ATPase
MTIKPSDVLGKYVGESEKNIARLFAQAHQQNAILFIDEVDSLLSSRASLINQHERQLVNQILVEIEQSELTIFAATNYAQNLDGALLRRFDFKLTLEYLTSAQVLTLYEEYFGSIEDVVQQQLTQLTRLTPGDFSVVSRRNRLSKKPLTDEQNLAILTDENNRKQQSQAIGFVH